MLLCKLLEIENRNKLKNAWRLDLLKSKHLSRLPAAASIAELLSLASWGWLCSIPGPSKKKKLWDVGWRKSLSVQSSSWSRGLRSRRLRRRRWLSLCSQLKRRRDLDAFSLSSLTSTSRVTYRNALVDGPKVTWQLQHSFFSCEITILNFIAVEKKVRKVYSNIKHTQIKRQFPKGHKYVICIRTTRTVSLVACNVTISTYTGGSYKLNTN